MKPNNKKDNALMYVIKNEIKKVYTRDIIFSCGILLPF